MKTIYSISMTRNRQVDSVHVSIILLTRNLNSLEMRQNLNNDSLRVSDILVVVITYWNNFIAVSDRLIASTRDYHNSLSGRGCSFVSYSISSTFNIKFTKPTFNLKECELFSSGQKKDNGCSHEQVPYAVYVEVVTVCLYKAVQCQTNQSA